jgi:DNA-binding NtrC family response regulator
MHDSVFQILFLGEDSAWSKISASVTDTPRLSLKIHRAQSLNELFLILAGGNWDAVAIDIQAWNFQGLHYVDKVRSEYPAFPILALCSSATIDLAARAKRSGASRALRLEELTAAEIHSAVLTCVSENKQVVRPRTVEPSKPAPNGPQAPSDSPSRTQFISHALNNLLCVITSNAEILAEHVGTAGPGGHSLAEIKKAAKAASDLMRMLK